MVVVVQDADAGVLGCRCDQHVWRRNAVMAGASLRQLTNGAYRGPLDRRRDGDLT
jgi:hypothetical protein